MCLTLNNLGLQTCSEENGGAWRILDCGSPDTEARTYPFGWYQKPGRPPAPDSYAASLVTVFQLCVRMMPLGWEVDQSGSLGHKQQKLTLLNVSGNRIYCRSATDSEEG